jgi:hypothetical protein
MSETVETINILQQVIFSLSGQVEQLSEKQVLCSITLRKAKPNWRHAPAVFLASCQKNF